MNKLRETAEAVLNVLAAIGYGALALLMPVHASKRINSGEMPAPWKRQ